MNNKEPQKKLIFTKLELRPNNLTVNFELTLKPISGLSKKKIAGEIILYGLAGGIVILKVITSIGQRWFSINDFFTNPDYLFHDYIAFLPAAALWTTTLACSVADGWVNGATRGPALFSKLTALFEHNTSPPISEVDIENPSIMASTQRIEQPSRSTCMKIIKTSIDALFFFGIACSAFSLIPPAYLGAVTLTELFTDEVAVHIALGMASVLATQVTNACFRFKKIFEFYKALWNGEIARPTIISLVTLGILLVSNLGMFYYGMTNGVSKMLDQLFGFSITAHDPILSKVCLGVSALSLLPLACGKGGTLFKRVEQTVTQCDSYIMTSLPIIKNALNNAKANLSCLMRACCIYLPSVLNFTALGLSYLSMGFDGLGNALTMFNASVGLMILFLGENPWAILPCAALLAFVDTWVYSKFNFPDMLHGIKVAFVNCVASVLIKTQGKDNLPEKLDSLIELLKLERSGERAPAEEIEDHFVPELFDEESQIKPVNNESTPLLSANQSTLFYSGKRVSSESVVDNDESESTSYQVAPAA